MFYLDINTDNDAFVDNTPEAVADVLANITTRILAGETVGRTMDANGNSVGIWSFRP